MSVGSVGSIDPTAKQALVDHLLAHSIKHGDFTLKSGRKSPYFLDSKQTACDPDGVVLMPDFVNQPLSSARQWAEEHKVSPEVKEEATAVFTPGNVIRQSPAPDSGITEKSAITFVVAASTSPKSDGAH